MRLKQEHDRARTIDNKTTGLAFPFSIVLGTLGVLANVTFDISACLAIRVLMMISFTVTLIFVSIAILIVVDALRTLPTFGYGTEHMLRVRSSNSLADSLARQETMNSVRQMRNEAAYQTIRNGIVAFFVTVIVSALALVMTWL